MSQIITITITSAGPDLGPYSILLVDNLGNVTVDATGVPKSALFAGYTVTIPDNIVAIRLQSVNADCPYTEFSIPAPPPPDPACFYVFAGNGYNVTWIDGNNDSHTEPYIVSSPVYCARVGSLSSEDPGAVIIGGSTGCVDGTCVIPPCICTTITNLSTKPTTYNYISCEGIARMNQPLLGSESLEVCGSFFNSPGLVDISAGSECVVYDVEYVCPTTTTSTTSTTTTTTIPPCDCVTVQSVKGDSVVNYTDCTGKGASQPLTDGVPSNFCARNVPLSPLNYSVVNHGPCIEGSICLPTTTTTTTSNCACYDITSLEGGHFSYVNCFGTTIPDTFITLHTPISICGSNPQVVSGSIVITPTGNACNFFGEDYFCPCICYNVTANTGDTITWTDCDGIEQTALYSGKLPLYCARPNTISVAGTFTAVAQGDCNPITSECITTTTTLFIG